MGSAHAGPGSSPGFLLWRLSHAWQRAQRRALRPLGLTHIQFVLMAGVMWMQGQGGPPTQRALSDHAGTDPMVTSQVVRALEARGLVSRHAHPRDARARLLRLTDAGAAVTRRAMVVVEAVDADFFSDGDAGQLAEMLRALLRASGVGL